MATGRRPTDFWPRQVGFVPPGAESGSEGPEPEIEEDLAAEEEIRDLMDATSSPDDEQQGAAAMKKPGARFKRPAAAKATAKPRAVASSAAKAKAKSQGRGRGRGRGGSRGRGRTVAKAKAKASARSATDHARADHGGDAETPTALADHPGGDAEMPPHTNDDDGDDDAEMPPPEPMPRTPGCSKCRFSRRGCAKCRG